MDWQEASGSVSLGWHEVPRTAARARQHHTQTPMHTPTLQCASAPRLLAGAAPMEAGSGADLHDANLLDN